MVSRTEKEFDDYLMKEKQEKFKEVVLNASKALGLSEPPKVKIWDGECPHGKVNELAHIHPDKGIICVSTRRLKQMTMDDIEEAATHEVAHMKDVTHDYSFKGIHSEIKVKTWKPPTGIVLENESEEKTKKSKEIIKEDKTRCNYHLCRKETKLKKCPYCRGYFCNKHISSKLPLTHEMVDSERSPILARIYEEEWRKEGGHPDAVYSEYKLNEVARKEKISMDKLMEALDKMKKDSKITDRLMEAIDKLKPSREETPREISQEFRIPAKAVAIIVLIIIVGYIALTYNKEIMNFLPLSTSKVCTSNYTKAYESGASFGRDPSIYCNKTCVENYNSTIYKVIEPNATYKMTVCYCDINNCKI